MIKALIEQGIHRFSTIPNLTLRLGPIERLEAVKDYMFSTIPNLTLRLGKVIATNSQIYRSVFNYAEFNPSVGTARERSA